MRFSLATVALLATTLTASAGDVASFYKSGSRTANGEHFRPLGLTAAHKRLPFGTRVKVTYRGRSVVVRINDRGPFIRGRSIDLSLGAARAVGLTGVGPVTLEIVS